MSNNKLTISLVSILTLMLIFNQFQITSLHNLMMKNMGDYETGATGMDKTAEADGKPSVDLMAIAKKIIPTGIPTAYGAELGVSYDDAAAAIAVLAPYEQDTRKEKLTGEKLERYIKMGQMISCEFCCSAKTMVFPDGRKACGCAHSSAMRGLVAYLLDNTDMSDQQILSETSKLKAVFFPGPTVQKYASNNGLISTPAQDLQQQVGGC